MANQPSPRRYGNYCLGPAAGTGRPAGAAKRLAEVVASLKGGQAATFDGVWGSACGAGGRCPGRPRPRTAGGRLSRGPMKWTPWSTIWGSSLRRRAGEVSGVRIAFRRSAGPGRGRRRPAAIVETAAIGRRPRLIVTSIQALLQPVPDREALARQTRMLRSASGSPPRSWRAGWSRIGFTTPGGGNAGRIFAPRRHRRYLRPRLVRAGAAGTLRRRNRVDPPRSRSPPAEPGSLERSRRDRCWSLLQGQGHFADYLPPQSWFLLMEPGELEEQGGIICSGWSGRRSCTRWPT